MVKVWAKKPPLPVGYRIKLVTMSAISAITELKWKCHSDSSSACYFCYFYQHIVSLNSHINDAHFWKEQNSHTSRKEHWMTPKQALVAPSLH